jgi:hypothetical protein
MNILTASVGKDGGIISNVDDVKLALQAYVRARNATVFDSVKKKMGDVALNAIKFTDYADRADIANKLKSLPITKDEGKKRYGNTQWVGLYKLMNWQRKNMGVYPLGGSKNRINKRGKKVKQVPRNTGPSVGLNRFMDGKTKAFVKARARGSMFLRIGWACAAAALGKRLEKGDFGTATLERLSGKAYGGGATIDKIAPGQSVFKIYNGAGVFDLRYKGTPMRSSSDIARARAKQEAGLKKSINFVLEEIAVYLFKAAREPWDKGKVTATRI